MWTVTVSIVIKQKDILVIANICWVLILGILYSVAALSIFQLYGSGRHTKLSDKPKVIPPTGSIVSCGVLV